jgi:hypothetical protein
MGDINISKDATVKTSMNTIPVSTEDVRPMWTHIALIIDSSNIQDYDVNRSMNKNASISIYINSELSATGVVSVPSRDETVLSTGTFFCVYMYIYIPMC